MGNDIIHNMGGLQYIGYRVSLGAPIDVPIVVAVWVNGWRCFATFCTYLDFSGMHVMLLRVIEWLDRYTSFGCGWCKAGFHLELAVVVRLGHPTLVPVWRLQELDANH